MVNVKREWCATYDQENHMIAKSYVKKLRAVLMQILGQDGEHGSTMAQHFRMFHFFGLGMLFVKLQLLSITGDVILLAVLTPLFSLEQFKMVSINLLITDRCY